MLTESLNERKPEFENLLSVWKRRREKILKRTATPEYPFGIEKLDKVTHGITRGKVTVIAARTSEAKTAFTLQTAFNLADQNKAILYITLEDDSEQIAERIVSNICEIDNQDLIRGKVTRKQLEGKHIEELFRRVKFLSLEGYGHNFDEIQEAINLLTPKPEIIFLDYVQMIEQLPRETEYDSLSRFAKSCKKFAEMNDIGLVLVSQINRAGANEGRPQAHHLQGCGRLEQVADLLLILYCPHNYNDSSYDFEKNGFVGMKECPADYVEVMVVKNKNGIRNWVVPTRFTGRFYKFIDWKETIGVPLPTKKFIKPIVKED